MNQSSFRANGVLIAALVFALDQWTKVWVMQLADMGELPIRLTNFLNVIISGNLGVSFGLFHAHNKWGVLALVIIASLLSLVVLYWLWHATHKLSVVGLGLILGGAVGNILDRVQFGKVIDFIDFHVLGYHWYTFNVADCGVVVGAFLYGVSEFYLSTKCKK